MKELRILSKEEARVLRERLPKVPREQALKNLEAALASNALVRQMADARRREAFLWWRLRD